MRHFLQNVRAFAKDESGVLLAEALITLPLLIWGFVALMVYWDVYRTVNVAQKAAYSISDLLSRQDSVTVDFIEEMPEVLDYLTPGASENRMRITSLEFDEDATILPEVFDADDHYHLLFSCSTDEATAPSHTETSIQALEPQIPTMDNLGSVIIVETWTDYQPAFDIGLLSVAPGLTNQTFTNFIVTTPRTRRLCIEDGPIECSRTAC